MAHGILAFFIPVDGPQVTKRSPIGFITRSAKHIVHGLSQQPFAHSCCFIISVRWCCFSRFQTICITAIHIKPMGIIIVIINPSACIHIDCFSWSQKIHFSAYCKVREYAGYTFVCLLFCFSFRFSFCLRSTLIWRFCVFTAIDSFRFLCWHFLRSFFRSICYFRSF